MSALVSDAVLPLVKFDRSSPNWFSSTLSTLDTLTLLAALSIALKIVSPHDTPAALSAVIALLFPSNAPSMESSTLTDCSKFKISVVCSLTVFVRFDTFDKMFDTSPFALNMAVFSVPMAILLAPTSVCSVDRFDSSVVIFDCAIVMLESAVSKRELFDDKSPMTVSNRELFDAKALAVADKMLEFEFTSARRPETSDAFVTVFDAALAIAVSRLEFRAITLASVPLRDEMIPSMRLELEDSWVLSSVTAPA